VRSKYIEIGFLTDTSLIPPHKRIAGYCQFFNPVYSYYPSGSLNKWWRLHPFVPVGFSDGNPDQDKRLVSNMPGPNGDDTYAKFSHIIDTLRLDEVWSVIKAF
jgi:hypothetical protein